MAGAQPAIPHFDDAQTSRAKPDLSTLTRLRFLTSTEFFPFNFLDDRDQLVGFHVDLARAICRELQIIDRCQIQVLPFEELRDTLYDGGGEAIIAGIAITDESRGEYLFSRPYLQFPARFLTGSDVAETFMDEPMAGKRVGVLADTAHEEMLRDLFSEVQVVTYSREEWLFADLKQERIAAAFGDGMRFAFWLAGDEPEDCCAFSGGPYLAPEYLGHGLAIAVRPDLPALASAIDYALQRIETGSTFSELYLRSFPVSFY
ncbi:transporter substrate-binding domain-containing protein [Chelativorans sp. YIM 93263]|uniref:transporter substrate-binding domain-containing protein n=1 Tax=Chelativorans sp. YIM 93263 TaxID=2906648 RepID=UPI0023788E6D|nr:transporter substrate-binding domain-containing protein [Chelativorans sp. YIM 93263]